MCKVTSSDSRRSLFAVLSFAMAVLIAGSMALSVALLPRAKPVLGAAQVVSIERISVPSTEGDGGSRNPSISADGRYVAFESAASNIVPNDNNGVEDIFVHDRHTGEIARVSVASDGTQGNGASFDASISADGRYVAFWSEASNLVTSDSNEVYDVFVHDRGTGETTRLSLAWDGGEADQGSFLPRISAYGRYVAFCSYASNLVVGDANDLVDIFVHDRQTGETTRVNNAWDGGEADNGSTLASISADGRYVAFESYATNLVANNENSYPDIYVHDRQTGETTRMSVSDNGTEGNDYSYGASISGDGRYVAFCSVADNLVAGDYNSAGDIFVHDRQTGQTTRVSVASDGTEANDNSEWASISADGRYVAFYSVADNLVAGDDNAAEDVFVHDRQTGETSRVSVASDSTQGDDHSYFPFVSADGRCVVFASRATNLVSGDANGFDDIFVHDRQTGETTRVSLGCNTDGQGTLLPHATSPSMSADGRYIAFESHAGNLVVSDTNETADIFVRDRLTGETTRVSVASNGAQGNHYSYNPSISADGRYVAFESMATNLVDDDGNGVSDIFVHDRQTGQTIRASLAWNGSQANQGSNNPSISANGRYVAFQSDAFNLVESDTNSSTDVFVRDLQTGQTSRVSVDSEGNQCNGHSNLRFSSISADGRYVVFDSAASNLVADDTNEVTDVFVHDRQTGQTRRVSVDSEGNQGNLASNYPTISADGRYVAFESGASNLVAGDTNGTSDIFVHDLETGETSLASLSYSGSQILGGAVDCGISADGRYVSFCSHDGNVVMGDTNGVSDIFVRDLYPGGTTIRVSLAAEGTQGNNHSMYPSVCADGKYAAFYSFASNLVPGDGNALWDAFVVSWQNPVLACAPTSIDFGARYQNFTATRTLQIQNTGTGTLSYGVSENGVWCSVNPSAGTSAGETDDVTVAIDTAGLSPGDYACVVLISSDGGLGIVPVYVSVQPSPVIEVAPASHDFGTVSLGVSSDRMFTVSNSGTVDLVIETVAGANALAAPFSIVSDNCSGQTIPPGGSRGLTVRFSPTVKGRFSDSFDIPSNDPVTPSVTVTLSGSTPNALPTAPVVAISPDNPKTADNLICGIVTESTDADGDTVTYAYRWYKNGELQSSLTGDTVAASETAKGHVWRCVVTPSDGIGSGSSGEDEVTIQNSAPTAPTVDVTPNSPVTSDDLVCSITTQSTDADGDTVTYTYQWYRDGEMQSGLTADTVSAAETGKGQVWRCVVTPSDGTASGPSGEDEVTVRGGGGGFPAGAIVGIVVAVVVAGAAGVFAWFRFLNRPGRGA